jgi:hypothetical protein
MIVSFICASPIILNNYESYITFSCSITLHYHISYLLFHLNISIIKIIKNKLQKSP